MRLLIAELSSERQTW